MSASLNVAKLHVGVTGNDDDTIITAYLAAATAWIERYIGEKLVAGTVADNFTEFGDFLELSTGPASTIVLASIAYTDENGDPQTLDTGTVFLQNGRIYPPTVGWPAVQSYSTITATYTCGYATTPVELEQAQLLLVGHFYLNREAVTIQGQNVAEVPLAVNALCEPFRTPTLR